jgi:ketosteroid isomerase-like protein
MRKAMSLEDNKQIVRRFIEEAINKGNVDASEDYIAEDVVELVPFPGQGPGLSGLKDVLKGCEAPFRTCIGRSRSRSPKPTRC